MKIDLGNWGRIYSFCVGAAIIAVGLYLGVASLQTPLGFPLDDAWIHQVFARNLAQHGQFAYNPGQLVAGSTSPLWSFLLTPGYLFGGDFYKFWAYWLGIIFLALTGGEVYRLSLLLFKPTTIKLHTGEALAAALFTVFEWHLVWAATSGMETVLFSFLSLWLVRLYLQTEHRQYIQKDFRAVPAYALLGLVGGLLTLVRPEGLVLLGLVGLETGRKVFFGPATPHAWASLGQRWSAIVLAWLLPIVPYALFNYASSGSPLPTTFYAKASGYASNITLSSTWAYLLSALNEILVHSALVFPLVLAAAYCLLLATQTKARSVMGRVDWRLLVWPLVVLLLYSLRLPVTYQHTRYLIPLVPFITLYGVWAVARLRDFLKTVSLPRLAAVLPVILGAVVAISWYNGALTYQSDVEVINDEQVQIGLWLQANTPPNTIVASHDIGAIEYFSRRHIVDTAGLVSPEFIPIVRDQQAILAKVQAEGVSYFALMPSWYDQIASQLNGQQRKVFEPGQSYLDQFREAGEVMQVFKLK